MAVSEAYLTAHVARNGPGLACQGQVLRTGALGLAHGMPSVQGTSVETKRVGGGG